MQDIKEWKTNRGFQRIDFKDMYDKPSSIQVSSNIDESLWIGTDENRMLINREDCKKVAKYLMKFYKKGILFKIKK